MKLTTRQVADLLGVKPDTVHQLVKRGHLKRYGSRGRAWFDLEDVKARHPITTQWADPDRHTMCRVLGCEDTAKAHGLCGSHYSRWRRNGDPELYYGPGVRPSAYLAAHARVNQVRGPAHRQPCDHCGGPAQDWAYDHRDPREQVEGEQVYSDDPQYYIALCRSCHKTFDAVTV